MDFQILITNLTNPTLLFFVLGIFVTYLKSDLEIPSSSSKFISLYLLFAIGFKGGHELLHCDFNNEILYSIFFGILIASLIPLYVFLLLKRKMSTSDACTVAATYGSVSAVTFVSAVSFFRSATNCILRSYGSGNGVDGITSNYCSSNINENVRQRI